jgi:hypothetical protein
MLPPFTDQKLNLVNKVAMFAILHNQYQVYWWLRTILAILGVLAVYYYWM